MLSMTMTNKRRSTQTAAAAYWLHYGDVHYGPAAALWDAVCVSDGVYCESVAEAAVDAAAALSSI